MAPPSRGLALSGSLALAAPATAQEMEVVQVKYRCTGGFTVPATYFNGPTGAWAVINADGQQVALELGPSGSGARYVSVEAWPGYVWHTKGAEAILLREDASGETSVVLEGCAVFSAR